MIVAARERSRGMLKSRAGPMSGTVEASEVLEVWRCCAQISGYVCHLTGRDTYYRVG